MATWNGNIIDKTHRGLELLSVCNICKALDVRPVVYQSATPPLLTGIDLSLSSTLVSWSILYLQLAFLAYKHQSTLRGVGASIFLCIQVRHTC